MSDISKVFKKDNILKVSIVSQVEHHLYFPESFLCTLCMFPIMEIGLAINTFLQQLES